MRLRNLQNVDPFEKMQEENVCLEDIPGLLIDPPDSPDSYEDYEIAVNYCE